MKIHNLVLVLAALYFLAPFTARAANEPKPVANFKLLDTNGQPFELHSLKGYYVVLSFIFTRCPLPNMCPMNMTLSKSLLAKWEAQSELRKKGFPIKILAVTLDPEYDTPAVLKKYAESQGITNPNFIFATGDPKTITEFASQFNIVAFPADNSISHNMKTVLLNPLMTPIQEFNDNAWTADGMLERIRASVWWWSWYFLISALLAIPGLALLLIVGKKHLQN